MTYLDPDDLDASWDALQRLIRGGETPDGEKSAQVGADRATLW